MTDDLKNLEKSVEDLVHLSERLAEENQALRKSRESLMKENAQHQEKSRVVHTRLKTIVGRLQDSGLARWVVLEKIM